MFEKNYTDHLGTLIPSHDPIYSRLPTGEGRVSSCRTFYTTPEGLHYNIPPAPYYNDPMNGIPFQTGHIPNGQVTDFYYQQTPTVVQQGAPQNQSFVQTAYAYGHDQACQEANIDATIWDSEEKTAVSLDPSAITGLELDREKYVGTPLHAAVQRIAGEVFTLNSKYASQNLGEENGCHDSSGNTLFELEKSLDFNFSKRIENLPDPIYSNHAATKNYVDQAITALSLNLRETIRTLVYDAMADHILDHHTKTQFQDGSVEAIRQRVSEFTLFKTEAKENLFNIGEND